MSFESGKFGVRTLKIQGPFDTVLFLDQVAKSMLPPLKEIAGVESVIGWAGPQGLLDREVPLYNSGEWLSLNVVVAKRVYPSKRLEADFRAACCRWTQANGGQSMALGTKADLKEDLKAAAFEAAPVGVDGVQVVIDLHNGIIYTTALSDAWLDRVVSLLYGAGVKVLPVDANILCAQAGVTRERAQPMDIGDGGQKEMFVYGLGREFLTWLWMSSEGRGIVAVNENEQVTVLVDGPLVLEAPNADSGVKKVTIVGDVATRGRETARALLSGKLLTGAKVMLGGKAGRVFEMALCADDLLLRGVKLPACESINAADKVVERMEMCAELWDLVRELVQRFALTRGDEMEAQLREWVASKGVESTVVPASNDKGVEL